MCQPLAILGAVVTCVLIAGCGNTDGSPKPTTTQAMTPRPLVEHELSGLLLSPEQVNAAMAATAMTVTNTETALSDSSATMAPAECLAIDGAAEATVYANSGSSAQQDQSLNDGDQFTHYVKQAVVLFPIAQQAGAFFDTSAQQWPACRQYSHLQSATQWTVGPISTANGVLSTTATEQNAGAPGWGCGRALTAKNNIIIDINTCSANPAVPESRRAVMWRITPASFIRRTRLSVAAGERPTIRASSTLGRSASSSSSLSSRTSISSSETGI